MADRAQAARSLLARLRGWQARKTVETGEGLYLSPCRGIHTFGMRMAIDAAYLDSAGRIIWMATLPPNRLGPWRWECRGVLELQTGTLRRTGCLVGDALAASESRWKW